MRILYIVPYTPNRIRVRPYQLLRALVRAGHEITLGTTWTNAEERAALARIAEQGISIVGARMTARRSLWNCTLALPSRVPLQSVYSWQPTLARYLRKAVRQQQFDVIQFEHLRGARYGLWLKSRSRGDRRTPFVWDSVDCISHLFGQASRLSLSARGRWMARLELRRTRRYERRLVRAFEQVVVTSAEDRRAFLELLSSSAASHGVREETSTGRITVVPNGVDLTYFSPPSRPREPATLVFTGKMSYHANITAVLHLVRNVMPAVWARRPNVGLVIAGKDPTREVRSLATRHGDPLAASRSPAKPRSVWVTGEVDDLRPFLRRAALAVVPVVYGAGIQNKVLEAMATATPVIASPSAARALEAQPGRDLLVAEGADFACSILSLLENPERRETLGRNGRRYVETRHSWDMAAAKLEEIYARLRESGKHVQKTA